MADLKVDYEQLEDTSSAAKYLKNEFDDLPNHVSSHSKAWGDSRIENAMHEFATNWDYRRDLLTGKISEFGEKVEGCIEAFHKADEKLYKSVVDGGEGGGE